MCSCLSLLVVSNCFVIILFIRVGCILLTESLTVFSAFSTILFNAFSCMLIMCVSGANKRTDLLIDYRFN